MTLNPAADLVLEGLAKSFGGVRAVEDLTISVRHGEFYSLLGPSGCGKTTTLRMIAGFEAPDRGEIRLADEVITRLPPNKRKVNTVFQHYALFPHLTVEDNVAYGLKQERLSKGAIAERLEEVLTTVRLQALRERKPRELSGGQQQRVALARALVKEPTVLLLDEPLAALDLKLRKAMQLELKKLQERVGITFVYVTHDQEEALTLSDRIAVMNDGRLLQEGTPEDVYERPRTRFVADFIGQTNLLEGTIESVGSPLVVRVASSNSSIRCTTDQAVHVGQEVTIAIRPERIYPAIDGQGANVVTGRLVATTYLGDLVQYEIAVGATSLIVQRQSDPDDPARRWGTGDAVQIAWDVDSALVLLDGERLAGEEDRKLMDLQISE